MTTARPGQIFLTKYGVATVLSCGDEEGALIKVSLWRVPNRSVLSASLAQLQHDAIIKPLPAAPGMRTVLKATSGDSHVKSTIVLVHSYSAFNDTFLVSPIGNESFRSSAASASSLGSPSESVQSERKPNLLVVQSSELENAKCAKYYPLIFFLQNRPATLRPDPSADNGVRRCDEAARLPNDFPTSTNVDRVFDGIESGVENIQIDISPDKAAIVREKVANMVPQEKEIKEIYSMLRDEEITVLLERGKERLSQLISREIPEATEQALRSAGIEVEEGNVTAASRRKAFEALDTLLANTDAQILHESIVGQFSASFDLFREISKTESDARLNEVFESLSEKTAQWQKETGRLLETRSVSLFMEGSQRLQARAANMFSMQKSLDSEARLTKAFTEGDVAVTRLKSIELGEAVRSRLFAAIEARSDSQGGLDGIIAGALTSLSSEEAGEDIQEKLHETIQSLQNSASAATKDKRETLISLMSEKSTYQDLVLLRVESVLVELDSHFGEDVSADDMVSLARGDGGTSSLFEPIAKRAAIEIENQLDTAEKSITDPTTLSVLSRVRRIVSGDLTLEGLVSEVADVLNDEQVVSAGESLIKKGEMVLDALESGSSSGSKTMDDVMTVVEKAGITKEAVIDRVGNMDMGSFLTTAESAVTDEQARQQLLSKATDSALDFVLRILPSLPIPNFDGVRDGLLYHLSNLSLEGFRVKKEDVHVEIAGIMASGAINRNDESNATKATEILCIHVQNISSVFENAVWSFEQTYMPYLRGSGMASAKLWGGTIKLRFELRKKEVEEKWEPVLCLHDRVCKIKEVDLMLQGEGKLTWVVNKLSNIFRQPLRDFVERTIVDGLASRSGALLESLNKVLSPHWSLILKTANLSMKDLAEISSDDVTSSTPDELSNQVDLVWRERVPLGINLLLNDDSGFVKVVDFPRGSQARKVAEARGLHVEKFNGATIMAVDGSRFERYDQASVMNALRDIGRPKTLQFLLADNEEAERVQNFVHGSSEKESTPESSSEGKDDLGITMIEIAEEGPLGIKFAPSLDNFCLVLSEFVTGLNGEPSLVKKSGQALLGHALISVNGRTVLGDDGAGRDTAVEALKGATETRPLTLGFAKPYLSSVLFQAEGLGGPEELVLAAKKTPTLARVVIESFKKVDGIAESRGVFIGDHLIFVNGIPVGAGCQMHSAPVPQLQDVIAMVENEHNFPIALTFARPNKKASRWTASYSLNVETAESFCVTATDRAQLGFNLGSGRAKGDVVVKAFSAVEGSLAVHRSSQGLAIEKVDGQAVPSYASCDMVMNALKRSWSSNGQVELLLCDDSRRELMRKLCGDTE